MQVGNVPRKKLRFLTTGEDPLLDTYLVALTDAEANRVNQEMDRLAKKHGERILNEIYLGPELKIFYIEDVLTYLAEIEQVRRDPEDDDDE